jgi:hypothetical protein
MKIPLEKDSENPGGIQLKCEKAVEHIGDAAARQGVPEKARIIA